MSPIEPWFFDMSVNDHKRELADEAAQLRLEEAAPERARRPLWRLSLPLFRFAHWLRQFRVQHVAD